jgi:hypothetical protein
VEVTGPLQYVAGRNPDFREVKLEVGGKVVLHFAQAYGFRNIQTIISKVSIVGVACHCSSINVIALYTFMIVTDRDQSLSPS